MGWQDRDYAQHSPRGSTFRSVVGGPRGSAPLIGGSIVTTIIAVNAAIYFLQGMSSSVADSFFGYGALWGHGVMRGQVWRLITAQYLHANLMHIFFNMFALHVLGRQLEYRWSWKKLLTIYTLCGLAGNVFYIILASTGFIDPDDVAVGASGCVYGIVGIVAVMNPHQLILLFGVIPMKMRTLAIWAGAFAMIVVTQQGSNYGGEACHLAGLVFGVWWAWKGDAWWGKTEWRMPRSKGRRERQPRGFTAKVEQRRQDAETIDRILRKVYEGGIHSLSEREKQALHDARERELERDQSAGRYDRL